MGNSCSAVCCGNDGNGEVNTNIAGKDRDLHNNNQYKMELMKNIHLVIISIIKLQVNAGYYSIKESCVV